MRMSDKGVIVDRLINEAGLSEFKEPYWRVKVKEKNQLGKVL